MKLNKKLLVLAVIAALVVSVMVYVWAPRDEGVDAERNQETPSDATENSNDTDLLEFKAVVNGIRCVDVLVHVNISDGLTEKEAELIAETTFIQVMGEEVMHQLDTLTFDNIQIEAHYTWGYDENDMGHVFDLTADLTTLQIIVSHCF
jgi:hypothetical protein